MIAPLAAVFPRVPALPARGVGVVLVQVLSPAAGPAGEHIGTHSDEREESPDCRTRCHQEEDISPPRHFGSPRSGICISVTFPPYPARSASNARRTGPPPGVQRRQRPRVDAGLPRAGDPDHDSLQVGRAGQRDRAEIRAGRIAVIGRIEVGPGVADQGQPVDGECGARGVLPAGGFRSRPVAEAGKAPELEP